MDTYTYKRVGDCAIQLDVYPVHSDDPAPVVVWIHGGALIFGTRAWVQPVQRQLLHEAGYAQVSIDYRLAPETKLPEIAADVEDAFRWLAENATRLHIDPARMGVIGHSAGGYLALLSGCCLKVKPRAIVSFYGYGDIVGDWYAKPDPHYLKVPAVDEATARQTLGSVEISEAAEGDRFQFYLYCRQQGRWPTEVLGINHHDHPEVFYPYCPERQADGDFPPTLLLHGTADTDVPYGQSVAMAAALKTVGVAHELVTLEGGGHTFDNRVKAADLKSGAHAEEVAALRRAVQWFEKYLAE